MRSRLTFTHRKAYAVFDAEFVNGGLIGAGVPLVQSELRESLWRMAMLAALAKGSSKSSYHKSIFALLQFLYGSHPIAKLENGFAAAATIFAAAIFAAKEDKPQHRKIQAKK